MSPLIMDFQFVKYFLALKQRDYNLQIMNEQVEPPGQESFAPIWYSLSSGRANLERHSASNEKMINTEFTNENQIYWKSNHLLTENRQGVNFVGVQQLDDGIQQNFLREHGSVINYQVMKLLTELENQGCHQKVGLVTWDCISDIEFADNFFDHFIQTSTFDRNEAFEFKAILQKREDWTKFCTELFSSVSRKMYWQLTYIFYICTNLLIKYQIRTRLTEKEIQGIANTYIAENIDCLKEKLYFFGQSSEIGSYIFKVIYTILLLLSGYFGNKLFCEIDDQECIRCSPNLIQKSKKDKYFDYKERCKCHRPILVEKSAKKNQKLARKSI